MPLLEEVPVHQLEGGVDLPVECHPELEPLAQVARVGGRGVGLLDAEAD